MISRLDQAITKLYEAFHSNTLNPECCKQCAVGNILDQTDAWKHLSDAHGSLQLNYVGIVHERLGRRFNGYAPSELLALESIFLQACGYKLPLNRNSNPIKAVSKHKMFEALSETVAFLCRLDGAKNVMDYSRLFEFVDDKPVHQLQFS